MFARDLAAAEDDGADPTVKGASNLPDSVWLADKKLESGMRGTDGMTICVARKPGCNATL